MKPTTGAREPHKLTGKGQATRARILEHAAELIYSKGGHATNNEQLRRAAGVRGSQLNHYFPTKERDLDAYDIDYAHPRLRALGIDGDLLGRVTVWTARTGSVLTRRTWPGDSCSV